MHLSQFLANFQETKAISVNLEGLTGPMNGDSIFKTTIYFGQKSLPWIFMGTRSTLPFDSRVGFLAERSWNCNKNISLISMCDKSKLTKLE